MSPNLKVDDIIFLGNKGLSMMVNYGWYDNEMGSYVSMLGNRKDSRVEDDANKALDSHHRPSKTQAIRERKKYMTFDHQDLMDRNPIGHGIGVSGGAMNGRLFFTLDEIDRWRSREPDTALILARADTVPDDIREIYAADGLLTARGGLTSHAAVVAHRLGRTGVVGCGELVCNEKEKTCRFNDVVIQSGDFISIDGQEGTVFNGRVKDKEA